MTDTIKARNLTDGRWLADGAYVLRVGVRRDRVNVKVLVDGRPRRRVYRLDQDITLDRDKETQRAKALDVARQLGRNARTTRHEYEPGDQSHRMHTDPLCRTCGQVANATVHP
ncbi:hypothetical protein ABN028_19540 [Actinopolymorpha sp. B17G11]|uniref:hypothetical protein n=1 Tax=Actinopolymorpha sp. B17G11 TaxID=3160861 RepID=UPI0032E50E72